MEIKVKLSNLRTSPRKVRQVIDLVRGKKALEAQAMLSFTVNKPARSVEKLLNSAIATAKHDFHLDENNLFISKITVDEGPKLKRWHPMSRGRAYPIIKRCSHIALSLSETNPTTPKKAKTEKAEVIKTEESVVKTKKVAAVKKPAAKRKTTTKVK